MNNIAGFIQPSVYSQPSVVGIMPQSMPIVATGGRSDIMTMAVVATIVVIVLFILYKNMAKTGVDAEDTTDDFKSNFEEDIDPLSKCGWEVIMSPSCPYCIRQKQILERHFPKFDKIFTDKPAEAVPTWVNTKTGKRIPGMQTYDRLLSMARC